MAYIIRIRTRTGHVRGLLRVDEQATARCLEFLLREGFGAQTRRAPLAEKSLKDTPCADAIPSTPEI